MNQALRTTVLFPILALAVLSGSCASNQAQLEQLQRENQGLRSKNQELEAELAARDAGKFTFAPIQRFTVGLAAAAHDFDSGAFEKLLQESLDKAAGDGKAALKSQTTDRELKKIRGMLVQQYLAAEEIPILISNLSFRLADAHHAFKIGGTIVPRPSAPTGGPSAENAAETKDEIPAVLRRQDDGRFQIEYEELNQGKGAVEVELTDTDMVAAATSPRAARQGDLSFNWRLNLAEVRVYEVDNFKGDVGRFLRQMRVGGASGDLSQFQTLQDSVFLFGYGAYRTDVVNQLRTPSFIDQVEVAAIPADKAESLTVQDDQKELLRLLGNDLRWQRCDAVDFKGRERVWRRPIEVALPFVSRQTSSERGELFYSLYTANGTRLLGNFTK